MVARVAELLAVVAAATLGFSDGQQLLVLPSPLLFDCQGRYAGFYADPDYQCQVFHVCLRGRKRASMLCPVGTAFSQKLLTCSWERDAECRTAQDNYDSNAKLYFQDQDPEIRAALSGLPVDGKAFSEDAASSSDTLSVKTNLPEVEEPNISFLLPPSLEQDSVAGKQLFDEPPEQPQEEEPKSLPPKPEPFQALPGPDIAPVPPPSLLFALPRDEDLQIIASGPKDNDENSQILPFDFQNPPPFVPPILDYVPPILDYLPPNLDYLPPNLDYLPPNLDYLPPINSYVPPTTDYLPPVLTDYLPPINDS